MHFFIYAKHTDQLHELCQNFDFDGATSICQQLGIPSDTATRVYLQANNTNELLHACQEYLWPEHHVTTNSREPLALFFTGQGAQYPKMAQELYQSLPVFKQHIDECCEIYQQLFNASLFEVIFEVAPDEENHPIHQTRWTQPALFTIEYAFAKTWQHFGLKPQFCMGHSVGEYPAATFANLISLEDGIKLIGLRGLGMQALPSQGTMAALMTDENTLESLMADQTEGILDVAAFNGPKQTVISGDTQAVLTMMEIAKTNHKIRSRQLTVSHAFHSAHMEPMLDDFKAQAAAIKFKPISSSIQVVSNLTGDLMKQPLTADYWAKHIRNPVRFLDGLNTLLSLGVRKFVEVGPQPILNGMAARSTQETIELFESCNSKNPTTERFVQTMGQLFVLGQIESPKPQDFIIDNKETQLAS